MPRIEVLAVENIAQLLNHLPHRSKYFTLFLAWDVPDIEEKALVELFRPLVDRGLAYFCAWGNRCSEVHDALDRCFVERAWEVGEADYVLMTTWHVDEPLEEALWFFSKVAIPSENHVVADFERFAVAVGNQGWIGKMKRHLSAPELDQAESELPG